MFKILFVIIVAIILIVIVWEFFYIQTVSKEEIFIFPENFKGVVLVVHNQKDGVITEKENGKTIYRVPQNGILKIKTPLKPTLSKTWYYFEDIKGQRMEFFYCFENKEMGKNKNKIYTCGLSTGTYQQGNDKIECTTFLVGTAKEIDSLSKVVEKLKPIELLKK